VSVSATGSTDSKRIRLNLTVAVTRTHFSAASAAPEGNPNAPSQGATLAITGTVTSENPHVKLGAFHTLDIEVNRDLRIIKEEWDNFALETVDEACVEGRGADVGALICGEGKSFANRDPSDKVDLLYANQ
jgi:protein pelota